MAQETSFFNSSKSVQIKPATAADIPYLDEQRAKLYEFHQHFPLFKYSDMKPFESLAAEDLEEDGTIYCIAYVNDIRVGYAMANLDFSPEMKEIWVDPNYRRQGIAKQLISKCGEWFKEQGEEYMSSTIYAGNELSLQMHLSCGWKYSYVEYIATIESFWADSSLSPVDEASKEEAISFCEQNKMRFSRMDSYYLYNNSGMRVSYIGKDISVSMYNNDPDAIPHFMRTIQEMLTGTQQITLVLPMPADLSEYGFECFRYYLYAYV